MPMAAIEAALEDIQAGKMVILVDDEDRENEGDSDHSRREGHAGSHQFHGQVRTRPGLSIA